jgi:competence protein ComEC
MKFWLAAYGLLSVSFFLLAHEWERLPDGTLRVTMLDVGQGDSMLITTPGNQRILVDGGPDLSLLERVGEELPFFDRSIELLILSHPDQDHITALPELLKRYTVKTVLMTGIAPASSRYQAFLHELHERGTEVILAESGNDLDLGEGVVLDILWPLRLMLGSEAKNSNNASIVAKLTWQNHPTSLASSELRGASILLTGDIEEKVEDALLREGYDLHADLLKVPHHGSKTSSSTGFLLAVAPDLALISVGRENTYGHPHPAIVERYRRLNIPLKRTDQEGNVELVFD